MLKKLFQIIFIVCFLLLSGRAFSEEITKVEISGKKGSWRLLVNDKEFYIKGVGCGLAKGKKGEDYLKLAKELGANSVRTWGVDQGNKYYLDKAEEYGLLVNAGIWLNLPKRSNVSYKGESSYKEKIRKQVLDYIRKFKGHPAILMWNVGNEVLFFSQTESEKIAFCKFLESLIQDIKQIDPHHPVIYAAASYLNIKYLKEYVPSLDIVGMNNYASVRLIQASWNALDFDIPYVVTEYGPYLPSDRPKDKNCKPKEMTDYQKASMYERYARQILEFKGFNLGGFVFHLGETTQESMTWWNLNEGNLKRHSYWSIYKIYTGDKPLFLPPRIKDMTISKVKNLHPGEIIDVNIEVKDAFRKNLSYEYKISTSYVGVLEYYVNEYLDIDVGGKGKRVKIEAPQKPGVYRLYCFVRDGKGNVSSINKTISVAGRGNKIKGCP